MFLTVAYFYGHFETIKVIGGSGDRLTLKVSWSRLSLSGALKGEMSVLPNLSNAGFSMFYG